MSRSEDAVKELSDFIEYEAVRVDYQPRARAALTALTDELAAKDARLKEVEAELNFVLELHGAAEAFKRVEAVLANALTASPPEQETEEDS